MAEPPKNNKPVINKLKSINIKLPCPNCENRSPFNIRQFDKDDNCATCGKAILTSSGLNELLRTSEVNSTLDIENRLNSIEKKLNRIYKHFGWKE